MKKYLRSSCSICKRSADRLVDPIRFTTDKCTITFQCEGRLFPVEYRSDGGITSAPQVGVTDWRPRGATIPGVALQPEAFVNLATGISNQIVLAVASSFNPAPGSTLTLALIERSNAPKDFQQYVFRMEGSFTTISGVEAGLEKKVLRFGPTDIVQVYLNGVQLDQGTGSSDYTIYDGSTSSSIPPNTIGFNTTIALSGFTQIDVVISAEVINASTAIIFKRNISDESRASKGAYENIDYVMKRLNGAWVPYYLFTFDLTGTNQLALNSILTAASGVIINGVQAVDSAHCNFMLAREPYSIIDRYHNLSVPLNILSSENHYLKYFTVKGHEVLYVTKTSIETNYPPMKFDKFVIEKTIQTAVAGVSDQTTIDGIVIIGPDE